MMKLQRLFVSPPVVMIPPSVLAREGPNETGLGTGKWEASLYGGLHANFLCAGVKSAF